MFFLLLVVSYLLGSFPTGYLLANRVKGINILEYGSGNSGATNVFRALGLKWAACVAVIDVTKGAIPIILGLAFLENEILTILLGLAAVCGHNWSIFLEFKGGRGVATSGGVVITLMPLVSILCIAVWYLVVKVTRYVSVASIAAALAFPVLAYFLEGNIVYFYFSLLMALVVIYQHKPNLKRLFAGNENRV